MPYTYNYCDFNLQTLYTSQLEAQSSDYLKNILLVWVQNEIKGLVPHRIYIIVEMFRSLPAVRGGWDEQLYVRIWSVNYRAKQTFKSGETQVWVVIINSYVKPNSL